MELYEEIKQEFTECENIHYVDESIIYSSDAKVEHRSEVKNGNIISHSTRLFSSSVCIYKNNLISVLRHNQSIPHLFHFKEKKLKKFKSNYIELRFVLSGTLTEEVNDEIITVNTGELLIVSENSSHVDILNKSDAVVINFTINNSIFNEVFFEKIIDDPLQSFLRESINSYRQRHGYLIFKSKNDAIKHNFFSLMQNLYHEINNEQPGYIDVCVGYLVRLFFMVSNYYSPSIERFNKEDYMNSLYKSVTNYINNNLNNISIDDLVKEFDYCPDFFNRLIKNYSGLTYSNYLISRRIEMAKKLLATTDLTIDEIIYECGYSNKGFFFKKFREYVKCNPSEYRLSVSKHKTQYNVVRHFI